MAQITIQKSKISVTKSNSKITERKQLEQIKHITDPSA